ncbi:MAG: L-threonylcarbamoyladenylate synthase [Bacteroidales bacterium]|nr:L-threonylcarbamoyladenylate synthase [Bacteroidales bacterium]
MLCKIYDKNPNPKELEYVADILRGGGVIIYPTDTLYAIGCDALNVRAVERVCNIKNIDPNKKYLSIVCADLSDLSNYAKVNNSVFKLMKRNLPGPFTFILHATTSLPKIYRNRKEVGIRVPDNTIALELVKTLGNPILSTSLTDDKGGIEYLTDPELIEERYANKVDMVIDGGYGNINASTIVNCLNDEPEIIRQGMGELQY